LKVSFASIILIFYIKAMKGKSQLYQQIWQVASQIPFGKVATYGQIARLAGIGGQARLVGYAMHQLPDDAKVPWHRVINAQGEISLPKEDGGYDVQKALLEGEGIIFKNGKIDLEKFGWSSE
jgi:methylated-DNA-protein-cysteine methyltransferase related protein